MRGWVDKLIHMSIKIQASTRKSSWLSNSLHVDQDPSHHSISPTHLVKRSWSRLPGKSTTVHASKSFMYLCKLGTPLLVSLHTALHWFCLPYNTFSWRRNGQYFCWRYHSIKIQLKKKLGLPRMKKLSTATSWWNFRFAVNKPFCI